jgi:hypothetical protein
MGPASARLVFESIALIDASRLGASPLDASAAAPGAGAADDAPHPPPPIAAPTTTIV